MRATVVLPTYNEAATIGEVVARLLAASPDLDVLVVDDASPDGTGTIADELAAAEPRVHVLHRGAKLGLGPAYRAGFRTALNAGAEAVLEMDADLSHDPADAPRLVASLAQADLAIGSRWVAGGDAHNWSRTRIALSRAGNFYARALLRLPVRDSTSGFRAYRRALLEEIPLDDVRSEGYGFQVEMAWRAWTMGFAVAEVPITFVERRAGASKMNRRIVAEAMLAITRWSLRRARAPKRPHPRSVEA